MRTASAFLSVLLTAIGLSAAVAQGQTESGFPQCKEDGSMPEGYNQCVCIKAVTYRGEFDDPKTEFRVQLPKGVVGIGGCTSGDGFKIYLTRPGSDEPDGDFPGNKIWVYGTESRRVTFQRIIEGWKQSWKTGIEEGRTTNVQLGPPEQTSLASLSAIHLKATWTERDEGTLISEMIVANHPQKDIVYQIGIVSPANRWEKNHNLFQAVVEGFRYLPQ